MRISVKANQLATGNNISVITAENYFQIANSKTEMPASLDIMYCTVQ